MSLGKSEIHRYVTTDKIGFCPKRDGTQWESNALFNFWVPFFINFHLRLSIGELVETSDKKYPPILSADFGLRL